MGRPAWADVIVMANANASANLERGARQCTPMRATAQRTHVTGATGATAQRRRQNGTLAALLQKK
jgi:hypothetical protein